MTAQYYARRDGEIHGPFGSHSSAMDDHVKFAMRQAPFTQLSKMTLLLDLSSVTLGDEREFLALMRDDPVLRAIFESGRRYERRISLEHTCTVESRPSDECAACFSDPGNWHPVSENPALTPRPDSHRG
ncbi:Uncharacterised protein [Mycobacteroides abscessus subsp. abscessus]|nr:Uncharacterised protein [Mycobacteroides abscessus subsp. abscessus]SKU58124.1 Uncharacterised protein [Mycobacteroides abscessus subsp. abscessus]